jgi:hypothetical protein
MNKTRLQRGGINVMTYAHETGRELVHKVVEENFGYSINRTCLPVYDNLATTQGATTPLDHLFQTKMKGENANSKTLLFSSPGFLTA